MKNEELDQFDETQPQQQPNLKFTFTVDETNLIFRALGELPHRVADPLMRNLMAQAQVLGWVQEALGEEQVASLDANVASQIEAQINPPVVTPPLPWAGA